VGADERILGGISDPADTPKSECRLKRVRINALPDGLSNIALFLSIDIVQFPVVSGNPEMRGQDRKVKVGGPPFVVFAPSKVGNVE